MTPSEKIRKVVRAVTKTAAGVLALVLFSWTPSAGKGILVYLSLLLCWALS
jgi:hypothetical protein